MIIRLTTRLSRKIGITPQQILPRHNSHYIDWIGHLFTASRCQYIILANTASLYSIVMHGRGISDDNSLVQNALMSMRERMMEDGLSFIFQRIIAPQTGQISYSKTGDRRAIGSINDMVLHARILLEEKGLSPFETATYLNDIPFSVLNFANPREAFSALKPPAL